MDKSVESIIGRNVRHRRWMLGVPRREIAEKVGLSVQQLYNYETGISRISAGRLWSIASHLETPVAFFFKDLMDGPEPTDQALMGLPQDQQMIELIGDYCRVPRSDRRELRGLIRTMAAPTSRF